MSLRGMAVAVVAVVEEVASGAASPPPHDASEDISAEATINRKTFT